MKKKVKIKEMRLKTGISNFDKLVEGGFEKNSINLAVGDSGSGKSIFGIQFLMQGIKEGEKCLYITFEEKKQDFFKNMLDFGWDLADLEKKGNFIFLEYTPEKVKTMLDRIVIDSITSFALLFEDDLKKREAALELFSMLRKWGCTSLLTYEEEPMAEKRATSKTLEFESDSIIAIYFLRVGKSRERFIEVLKMRGTKHSREIFPFSIDKKGISVSSKAFKGNIK